MATMHLAFYKGRPSENRDASLVDKIVCFFTGSRYSHLELVYDYSSVTEIGYCGSSSPRDGGIRTTRIEFNPKHWEIFKFETDVSQSHVMEWFGTRTGAKYDWLGAIGVVFPFVRQRKQRWFCSEAIATCLGLEGARKMSPQDIFDYYKGQFLQVM